MAVKRGRPYKGQAEDLESIVSLEEKLVQLGKENFGAINKLLGVTEDLAKVSKTITEDGKLQAGQSKDQVKILLDQLEAGENVRDAIMETAPGFFSMAAGAKKTLGNLKLMATSGVGLIAIGVAIGKAFLNIQKAVTDTRKELGVSYTQAVAITAQNKVLAQVAKGFGLSIEDITAAQAAIRQDLGASVQESVNLSLNFARTAASTGQTASQLSKTLSVMESVSSASRDVLLNQIQTNAALAGQAGVAPALVMQDIADNAQFFAKFAKDGGMNILNASIAARKLGLELSAVESISESLLNFESSIENQLQASLLLGRQINLDRARQLAITGDQEGVMREILKQVGGEVEFNRLNVIQRKALADSVGVNVEQLSRLVRNNVAGAPGAVAGATNDQSLSVLENIRDSNNKIARAI